MDAFEKLIKKYEQEAANSESSAKKKEMLGILGGVLENAARTWGRSRVKPINYEQIKSNAYADVTKAKNKISEAYAYQKRSNDLAKSASELRISKTKSEEGQYKLGELKANRPQRDTKNKNDSLFSTMRNKKIKVDTNIAQLNLDAKKAEALQKKAIGKELDDPNDTRAIAAGKILELSGLQVPEKVTLRWIDKTVAGGYKSILKPQFVKSQTFDENNIGQTVVHNVNNPSSPKHRLGETKKDRFTDDKGRTIIGDKPYQSSRATDKSISSYEGMAPKTRTDYKKSIENERKTDAWKSVESRSSALIKLSSLAEESLKNPYAESSVRNLILHINGIKSQISDYDMQTTDGSKDFANYADALDKKYRKGEGGITAEDKKNIIKFANRHVQAISNDINTFEQTTAKRLAHNFPSISDGFINESIKSNFSVPQVKEYISKMPDAEKIRVGIKQAPKDSFIQGYKKVPLSELTPSMHKKIKDAKAGSSFAGGKYLIDEKGDLHVKS